MTVKKQIEMEEARRKEMREREEEYKERIRMLEEWRQMKEEEAQALSDKRLKAILEKMSKSQIVHSKILQKVASEAKLKNDQVAEKMVEIKEKKVKDEQDYIS